MSTISNDEVAIRITVDQNQANQAILEINDNLKTLATGSEKAAEGTNKTSISFTELNQALELGSKALSLITSGYAQLAEVMDRGNDVAEVSANFDKLQESIGGNATQALEGLRVATQGTVSDFDLMVQASKAVRAGIPTDAFIQGTESAVKLGEAMGVDAAQAMEILTTAMSKGNDRILQQIGVNVDLEQAYKDFATTLGTTADKLTELEKREAAQAAILNTVNEAAKGAAEGAGGAGEAFQTIAVAIENQRDKAFAAIASNEDLEQIFKDITTAINDIDLQPLITSLGEFTSSMIEALPTIIKGIQEFLDIISPATQGLKDFFDVAVYGYKLIGEELDNSIGLTQTQKDFNTAITETSESLNKLKQALAAGDAAAAKEAYAQLAGAMGNNADVNSRYARILEELQPKVIELNTGLNDQKTTIQQLSKQGLDVLNGKLTETKQQMQFYKDALSATNEEGFENLANTKELQAQYEKYKGQVGQLETAIKSYGKGAKGTASNVGELTDEQKRVLKEIKEFEALLNKKASPSLDEFKDILLELKKEKPSATFEELASGADEFARKAIEAGYSAEDLKKVLEDLDDGAKDLAKNFEGALAQALNIPEDTFDGLFEGIKVNIEDLSTSLGIELGDGVSSGLTGAALAAATEIASGGGAGAAIGAALGAIVGGYFGAGNPAAVALGAQLGATVGNAIEMADWNDIMGKNKNAAANLRTALVDFFDEAIKELHFDSDILWEGDFLTPSDRNIFDPIVDQATGAITSIGEQLYEGLNLSRELEDSFRGLGFALATSLGEGNDALQEILYQFGDLLAINFQNAEGLNEIQMLMQGMGLSLEDMEKALTDAFDKGILSADEFLIGLNATRDLFEKGIPSAIGATNIALDNFREDSLSSGAAAKDALGDLAAEFQEYNESIGDTSEKSLDDLKQYLIATGQLSVDEANALFSSFASAGIDSLEGLLNASSEQTAHIIDNAQAMGFAFQENTDTVRELREELDAIKDKEVNLKVNIQYQESGTRPEGVSVTNQTSTTEQGQGVG